MHKTEGANHSGNLFVDGPPGTTLEEDWLNAVQGEFVYFIEQAGFAIKTAATDSKEQLHESISILAKDQRARFSWKDADEIYLDHGYYAHLGTTNQIVYWGSQITYQFGPAGSNADSIALGNGENHYVYLDDSAIVTKGNNVITASELVNNKAIPVWNNSKKGWYNNNDKCIFEIRTDEAGAIREFFHDGEIVTYANLIADLSATDIDVAWTDVILSIPEFCTHALATFIQDTGDAAVTTTASWRTNGQTGTTGHSVVAIFTATEQNFNSAIVGVEQGTRKIEVVNSQAGVTRIGVNTDGWIFPLGM